MKNFTFIILLMLVPKFGYSQVGINTTTPNAQLDIRSSNQVTPSNYVSICKLRNNIIKSNKL